MVQLVRHGARLNAEFILGKTSKGALNFELTERQFRLVVQRAQGVIEPMDEERSCQQYRRRRKRIACPPASTP